jgi:hypothetical protein
VENAKHLQMLLHQAQAHPSIGAAGEFFAGRSEPFFIEADLPLPGTPTPFRRLMIAQDTGSAIVGPARADLFFGAEEEAGKVAGASSNPGASPCWCHVSLVCP